MRHSTQSFLGDKLASLATHAIGLVLDTYQGVLEVLDEFQLTGGQLACLLLGECGGTLFKDLEGGRRVGDIIALGVVDMARRESYSFWAFASFSRINALNS